MEPEKPVGGDAEDLGEIASPSAEFHPHRFAIVLIAIVFTVWGLVMTAALQGAALGAHETGTVLVVFPPMGPDHEAYDAIVEAGGGVLEKSLFVNAWIARSSEPGFVGRLLDGGAWRVFDPAPIQALMVVGCFSVVSPLGAAN